MTTAFATALDRANRAVLSRLSIDDDITLNWDPVVAIFDNGYAAGSVGIMGMASTQPMLTLATADVPDSPVGMLAVVHEVTYTVASHQSDGLGMSTLYLERTV